MKTPVLSIISIASVVFASPVAAQLGGGGLLPQSVTAIHTQEDDPRGGAYGIWAAGRDYKVSFHDGATFIPYLGSDYPHNQPFRWTTTSVTAGDEELVTRAKPVGRQVSDTRYEYDHGGVIEAYDVLLEGIEQTFVIHAAPAAGDLVVRGTVETALIADRVVDRHAAVSFADHQGNPIVSYGASTAVDAAGRRMPMRSTFANGNFALELDADWLRDATYPVVVDPLVGNVSLNTSNNGIGGRGSFDVLREDGRATENVWISYTRHVSATDQDLWVMRTDDDLPGPLSLQAFVDITAAWGIESCALAHTASRVICAFVRDFGTTRDVRWHAHHIDDLASRTGFGSYTNPSGVSGSNWRVDIGGNRANSASKQAILAFQHEPGTTFANGSDSSARFACIDMSAATSQVGQGQLLPVTVAAYEESERPKVNQVADGSANGNHWCVVWQRYIPTSGEWDTVAHSLGEGPSPLDHLTLGLSNGAHELGPIVAGSGGRYLVTYAVDDAASTGKVTGVRGHELHAQRIDTRPDGWAMTLPHPSHPYLGSSAAVLETGGIAYNTNTDSHWLLVTGQGTATTADEFGYRGHHLGVGNPVHQTLGSLTYPIATCSFDADNDSYVIVGSVTEPGVNPLFGNVWDHLPIPPPTQSGTGCSPADLNWSQLSLQQFNQRIGHEYSGALVTGVPSGGLASLSISLSSANIPLNLPGIGPGCSLLVGNPSVFLPGVGSFLGTAWWGIPLNENLPPVTFHLQAFHLDASGSAFVSTQRLSVPISH